MVAGVEADVGRALARIRGRLFGDRPARVGRFEVLGLLGEGGMGVVYEARDPLLDRPVAIKRVRAGDGGTAAQQRLLREARALARVVHPNVVAIYDTGVIEGDVYLAMERVEGPSLRTWLTTPRTATEIVASFVAIGEALAAVHEAGLVHRDFKPDNVVMGGDRPRVLDFGLAYDRAAGTTGLDSTDTGIGARSGSSDAVAKITRTGTLMGTPAYMAPEQYRGVVDARCDQYAYCVALYEALAGVRPFVGADPEALVRAARRGRIDWDGPARKIPPRVRLVLARGLSPDPLHRFPTMRALLGALAPARNRRWAALAIAPVGLVAWWLATPVDAVSDCPAIERPRAEDPAVLADAAAAFTRADPRGGADRWTRVRAALDARVVDWNERFRAACESPTDEATAAARATCLARGRAELDALVDRFRDADAQITRNGLRAVLALPPSGTCNPGDRASTPDHAAEAAIDDALAEAHSHLALGRFTDAAAAAGRAWQRAHDHGDRFAEADALSLLGDAQRELGDPEAVRTLEQALWQAHGLGYDECVARAATRLIVATGYGGRDIAAAEHWAAVATTALDKLGEATELRAAFHENLGVALHSAGRRAEAREHYEAAIALGTRAVGAEHPNVAHAELDLAVLEREQGESAQSIARLDRVLATQRAMLGVHPDIARILANLATSHLELGDREAAMAEFDEALAICEQTIGLEHPMPAIMMTNTAVNLAALGRVEEALLRHDRAISLIERVLGPDHPELARALTNRGHTLVRNDRHAEARAPLERALVIRQSAQTPDLRGLGRTLRLLGEVALAEGDLARAKLRLAEAIDRYVASEAPEQGDLGQTRALLAKAELALAEPSLAAGP